MLIPKSRLHLICKCQQRHNRRTTTHKSRLRQIGIQHLTLKHRIRFRIALPYHDRYSRLDDSSFFKGNFRKSFTKEVTVIKTYVSDDTNDRTDNVRTIKTTSQASLQNNIIDFLTCKPVKSHRCSYLKE